MKNTLVDIRDFPCVHEFMVWIFYRIKERDTVEVGKLKVEFQKHHNDSIIKWYKNAEDKRVDFILDYFVNFGLINLDKGIITKTSAMTVMDVLDTYAFFPKKEVEEKGLEPVARERCRHLERAAYTDRKPFRPFPF